MWRKWGVERMLVGDWSHCREGRKLAFNGPRFSKNGNSEDELQGTSWSFHSKEIARQQVITRWFYNLICRLSVLFFKALIATYCLLLLFRNYCLRVKNAGFSSANIWELMIAALVGHIFQIINPAMDIAPTSSMLKSAKILYSVSSTVHPFLFISLCLHCTRRLLLRRNRKMHLLLRCKGLLVSNLCQSLICFFWTDRPLFHTIHDCPSLCSTLTVVLCFFFFLRKMPYFYRKKRFLISIRHSHCEIS